jgi:hypothetical protein
MRGQKTLFETDVDNFVGNMQSNEQLFDIFVFLDEDGFYVASRLSHTDKDSGRVESQDQRSY